MSTFERSLSGLPGLDSMLDSIRMGDNVVWQVSSMDDYMHFVIPLYAQLRKDGKELLYMLRRRIKAEGRDAFYGFKS